jgi:hypothetical protein
VSSSEVRSASSAVLVGAGFEVAQEVRAVAELILGTPEPYEPNGSSILGDPVQSCRGSVTPPRRHRGPLQGQGGEAWSVARQPTSGGTDSLSL